MKPKTIIITLALITLIMITSCTLKTQEEGGVKINFYDKDGNLIGTSKTSNQETQSLIRIPLNKIPSGTASIGFEVDTYNDGDAPLLITYTKADFIGEFQ
jgi:hypothetical protein